MQSVAAAAAVALPAAVAPPPPPPLLLLLPLLRLPRLPLLQLLLLPLSSQAMAASSTLPLLLPDACAAELQAAAPTTAAMGSTHRPLLPTYALQVAPPPSPSSIPSMPSSPPCYAFPLQLLFMPMSQLL